jgi:gamma-glutamylcyclotransferase (GGCT)/AIG2-like uncharacterized protein YtfP
VKILVIGSALRSVSDDAERMGMTFLEEAQTAPRYRLYALEDRWAALVADEEHGTAIAGELYEFPPERFEDIVGSEPPGITQGQVELADGRRVHAAVGDPAVLDEQGVDITSYGGFAAYLATRQETG